MQDLESKIVAAIPCFNTERHIADVVSRAKVHVDRVVVIDDGSDDDTARTATAAGALVLRHGENKGYGEAIRSCFRAANMGGASIVVILDGDGQHDPDDIPRLVAPIRRGEADVVIGSRFLTNQGSVPQYRKFGIKVITLLWNFGSKTKVSDSQSGFRAFSNKVLKSLRFSESGMGSSIEILEIARRRRSVIREIPVSCEYSRSRPYLGAIRHGLGVALAVVRIRLQYGLLGRSRGERT